MKLKIVQDIYTTELTEGNIEFTAPCAVCKYFKPHTTDCGVNATASSLRDLPTFLIYEYAGDLSHEFAGCETFKYNESKRTKLI